MSVELHGTVMQRRYQIDDETKVGEARRDAVQLAHLVGGQELRFVDQHARDVAAVRQVA